MCGHRIAVMELHAALECPSVANATLAVVDAGWWWQQRYTHSDLRLTFKRWSDPGKGGESRILRSGYILTRHQGFGKLASQRDRGAGSRYHKVFSPTHRHKPALRIESFT